MKSKNYIGITGITNKIQIPYIMDSFMSRGIPNEHYNVMIGILVSPRNLDPTWCSTRYPYIGDIKSIVREIKFLYPKTFVTLHIDEKNTSNWVDSLFQILEQIDINVDGVQINVKHPKVEDMQHIYNKYPELKVIMQYSDDFLSLDVDKAMSELSKYSKYIDYLLIDQSRGRGITLDIITSIKHYKAIKETYCGIYVGFAGGFHNKNIGSIFLRKFNENISNYDYSLDVETGVRNKYDLIDLNLVDEYVKEIVKYMV